MPIRLVCVGKLGGRCFREAAAEYERRISRYLPIETAEVRDEPLGRRPDEDVTRIEGERILAALPKDSYVFLADRSGSALDSEGFAARLDGLLVGGRSNLAFIIGGTLGVSESVRQRADYVVSFSRMTMGHELARIVLLEQLYRAFTIIRGEKYHRFNRR